MVEGAFPTVRWGDLQAMFLPKEIPPSNETPILAAMVFAFEQERFVVADIIGRGWCIPGGHLEPGETPEQAVRREAYEEAGLTLGPLRLIGHYLLIHETAGGSQIVPTYTAPVTARAAGTLSGSDSKGVCLLKREEAPAHYYRWDPLIAAVFDLAWRCRPE